MFVIYYFLKCEILVLVIRQLFQVYLLSSEILTIVFQTKLFFSKRQKLKFLDLKLRLSQCNV